MTVKTCVFCARNALACEIPIITLGVKVEDSGKE